eukprot:CAMPEP_0185388026 /NCGR_PEP_ID=MMETSP1364-20130426/67431_1 /TAXON_ID=38817 /ORGANISM="Gephyrocapsa oceanica, Strain RCC1303" /LENGTH=57 /DNA_ID=CAMNT_0027989935 /DNA_START=85 /DNA_END=258 /DNA_ORIENTATION=+
MTPRACRAHHPDGGGRSLLSEGSESPPGSEKAARTHIPSREEGTLLSTPHARGFATC